MRVGWWWLVVGGVLGGCGPAARPQLEPFALSADRTWLRDGQGRVVLLRGINFSGLEFSPPDSTASDEDFAHIASWGLSTLRLAIAWSELERTPGVLTNDYLAQVVDPALDKAHAQGLSVVLDLHQFLWSPYFGGVGLPRWAVEGRGYPSDFSGPIQASCDFFTGATAPDGRPLVDHLDAVWSHLAARYAHDARVVGFDLFNEPQALGCLPPGKTFEHDYLMPLYRRLAQTVRAQGAGQTLFLEPPVNRATNGAYMEPVADNVVYAPHLYTDTFGLPELKYQGSIAAVVHDWDLGAREAADLNAPLWVAEFGGSADPANGYREATEQLLRDVFTVECRRFIGGAAWAYFPSDNVFSVTDAAGAEKGALVKALVRPYPRRVAGLPRALSYDEATRTLSFSFENDPDREVPDPTELFVPFERLYPEGVTVEVDGDDVAQLEPSASRVLLYRGRGQSHTVRLSPRT